MSADEEEWLRSATRQIRLDLLAVDISRVLSQSGVPHVVIKGVTTARWLYHPPREYRDVDILLPVDALRRCVSALIRAGLARGSDARLGEEASHSYQLVSSDGAEIDVHVTLPTLDAGTSQKVWTSLVPHIQEMDLDVGSIPALARPARCVVLAMHVIASGYESEQVREDLRRALAVVTGVEWQVALAIADSLGLRKDVESAVDFIQGRPRGEASAATRLRLTGASAAAVQLERFKRATLTARIRMVCAEALPSRAFMIRYDASSADSSLSMARSRIRRLHRMARMLLDRSPRSGD